MDRTSVSKVVKVRNSSDCVCVVYSDGLQYY